MRQQTTSARAALVIDSTSPVANLPSEFGELALRAMFWRPRYLALSAWLEHLPFAFWLTEAVRPRCFVELGTHYGASYFAFCQAVERLDLDTRCFAIDTWQGDEHASMYGEEVFAQVHAHNQAQYSGFSRLVRSSFDEALPHFPDASIDLLHIDGLHTYEAVLHDFESWLPKLSSRAVVVMHDTNVRERGFGVFKLFAELAQRYPHFEFAHGHGLGILGVGPEQPPLMHSLYRAQQSPVRLRAVQETFGRLGQACAEAWETRALQQRLGEQQQRFDREQSDALEQQALSRGTLAERITAEVQRNARLQVDCDNARQQLLQIEAAQAQALPRLAALEAQNQSLSAEKAELAASLAAQQALLAQAQQQLQQTQAQIQRLEGQRTEETTNTTEALALLHAQLGESHAARAALEARLAELQSTLSEQIQRFDAVTQARAGLQAGLAEAQARIAELNAAGDAAREELALQHGALAEQRTRLVQLEQQLVDAQQGAKEQAETANASIAALEQSLASELQRATALAESEVEARSEIARLSQQLASDQERAALLTEEAVVVQAENVRLQQQRDALRQINADFHLAWGKACEERSAEREALAKAQQAHKQAQHEIAHLTQALAEREASLALGHQALDTRLAENHRLAAERDAGQIEHARLAGELQRAAAHAAALQASLDARFGELASLVGQLEARDADLHEARLRLAREQQKAARLRRTFGWRLTTPMRWLLSPFEKAPAQAFDADVALIRASGLFDEAWYARQLSGAPTGGLDPVEHYLKRGAAKGLSPSPGFDPQAYLARYADVATSGLNPLVHYIRHGRAEGRLTF